MPRLVGVSMAAISLAALGCSSEQRPPHHPVYATQDRSAMRIQLVPLVVKDEARATQVASLYQAVDALGNELEQQRAERLEELRTLDRRRETSDAEFEAVVRALRADGRTALQRYTALQLQLRAALTAEEFERLDKVR